MKHNLKLFHKGLSFITGLLLVFQSVSPGLFALKNYVFAQEEEPTPTVTQEPTPTPDPTPTETLTPTEAPTPTPTEEVTPVPTETETIPTPTTSEPPHETSPPAQAGPPSQGEILDGVSTTELPAPHVDSSTTEEGQVTAVVLEDTKAETLDLEAVDPTSATLTTDKADYAPTDTVVITGNNFEPNTRYSLSITSSDEPAYSFSTSVTTDGDGSFVYAHQLDGKYRPNYQVNVTTGESTVTSTTFTDSPPSGCFNDSAGANDEPGQKDLSKACVDYTGLPTSLDVDWNWDEIAWSGANTGDACSLYDTDNDGFANYSLCVRVSGNPASYQNHVLFSCTDTKADRCSGSAIVANTSSCSASVQAIDPFLTGDEYPNDTGASCTVNKADVGGTSTVLLDVCSYPSQQPNSDPSDCIFASTASQTGLLEVRKTLSPTNDSGLFDLSINSVTYAVDVGNNGTTGEKTVDTGNNTFGETAGTNTSLSDYTSAVQCLDSAGAQVSTTGTNPWTVNIDNGDDIVCTITNTRNQGTLQVIKTVVNDNGATLEADDFSFQVNGGTVQAFEADGQNDLTVSPGTYSVTEPSVTGYTTSYNNCSDIVLANGQTQTCYVTNNDISPTLTLVKTVVNDDGGTNVASDFTLRIDGAAVTSGVANTVNAGSHTASEVGLSGYSASTWGGDCAADGTITLNPGDTKTCTITNNDNAPRLKLVKVVNNQNGGNQVANDWILYAAAYPNDSRNFSNLGGSGSFQTVFANVGYVLSEPGPSGYQAGTWFCDAGNLTGDTLVLPLGVDTTCTITNNDIAPLLTVTKIVSNDNGGNAVVADFPLFVNTTQVTSGAQNAFNAGSYVVSETTQSGYTQTIGGDCDTQGNITLAVGDVKSCTITNDDEQATLTLTKILPNDDGGTAVESDFNVYIDGNPTSWGTQTYDAGSYTISEDTLSGYIASGWGGDCDTQGNVTLNPGESKTCTIVNDDQPGTLIVQKIVVNDNGGNLNPQDFTYTVNSGIEQTFESDGQNEETVPSGTYTVTEGPISGYSTTYDNCTEIVIDNGESATCTITNDDEPATLTLTKILPNDDGGTATQGDFPVYLDEEETDWGTQSIDAGNYVISEDTLPGYLASGWGGDCDSDGNVTLNPGESKTCTVVNDDIEPKLTVTKVVIGGTEQVSDFPLFVDQTEVTSGVQNGFSAGAYTVSETAKAGYTGSFSGDCAQDGSVTLNPGDEKSCTITNTRDQGTLTVNKVVGDTINPAEFFWGTASDQTNTAMGDGVTLDTGSYDVFENTVSGYQFTGWFYGDPRENEFSCENPQFTELPKNIEVTTEGNELTLCNKLQNPILTISKSNDAAGDKNPGDSVLFTIVVTATQSAVFNVKVTDLAAGGFTYRAGSWTAKKNGVPVAVSEPVYASPGVWSIGDMNVNDVVTLTYIADISSDQKPGLYKDLVWAAGDNVLAMGINPGFVSDNFAGTQVNVVKEQQSSSSMNVEHKEEVLGAFTELPATGANSIWLIVASMLFLSGTAIIIVGRRYA